MKNLWMASIAGLALAGAASANVINLSDLSSDGGIDPADLSGTIEFTLTGNQLSIVVTNNTANFTISEFLFNAPDDVTLSFAGLPGWSMFEDTVAGPFGTFDFALIDGVGGDQNQVFPGESVKFDFTVLTGDPVKSDFTTLFSAGGIGALGAAKFRKEGFFVFGAAIPGPAGLALLGVAGAFGRRRRR